MKLYNLFRRNFPRLNQLSQSEKPRLLPPIVGALAYGTGILSMSSYLSNSHPQPNTEKWEENIDGAMRLQSVETYKTRTNPPIK